MTDGVIKKIFRKKLKCPHCKGKTFNIYETMDGVEVVCKKCDTVFVGFERKDKQKNN